MIQKYPEPFEGALLCEIISNIIMFLFYVCLFLFFYYVYNIYMHMHMHEYDVIIPNCTEDRGCFGDEVIR